MLFLLELEVLLELEPLLFEDFDVPVLSAELFLLFELIFESLLFFEDLLLVLFFEDLALLFFLALVLAVVFLDLAFFAFLLFVALLLVVVLSFATTGAAIKLHAINKINICISFFTISLQNN